MTIAVIPQEKTPHLGQQNPQKSGIFSRAYYNESLAGQILLDEQLGFPQNWI